MKGFSGLNTDGMLSRFFDIVGEKEKLVHKGHSVAAYGVRGDSLADYGVGKWGKITFRHGGACQGVQGRR